MYKVEYKVKGILLYMRYDQGYIGETITHSVEPREAEGVWYHDFPGAHVPYICGKEDLLIVTYEDIEIKPTKPKGTRISRFWARWFNGRNT